MHSRFVKALMLFLCLFGLQMFFLTTMSAVHPTRAATDSSRAEQLRVVATSTRVRACCSDFLLFGDAQLCEVARMDVEAARRRRKVLQEKPQRSLESLVPVAEWIDPQVRTCCLCEQFIRTLMRDT